MILKKCILLVFALFLSGCYTYYDSNPPKAEPTVTALPAYYYDLRIPVTANASLVVTPQLPVISNIQPNSDITQSPIGTVVYPQVKDAKTIEASMMNVDWISPGKVTIENLYKGSQAEYSIRIHNGGKEPTIFQVISRQPDGSRNDKLPWDCMDWVQISKNAVYVPAKSTVDVPVVVKMLKDADMKGKTYEFWVSVINNTQKGMVQTEMCSRWIIMTRN